MAYEIPVSGDGITDRDIEALVDSQLGWEDEKRVWLVVQGSPALRKKYDQLMRQKKLLMLWWSEEQDGAADTAAPHGRQETLSA